MSRRYDCADPADRTQGLREAVGAVRRGELVEAFWPGPLTIVAMHQPSLRWDLGDTRGTVAVRMPLHPVAIELLEQTGPMAVSSANLTGHPSPQDCDAAQDMLGEAVSVYLDG